MCVCVCVCVCVCSKRGREHGVSGASLVVVQTAVYVTGYSDHLTGYSDYLTGFREPLSPPSQMLHRFEKCLARAPIECTAQINLLITV